MSDTDARGGLPEDRDYPAGRGGPRAGGPPARRGSGWPAPRDRHPAARDGQDHARD